MNISCRHKGIVSRAAAVQAAVRDHQSACRYTCRQAKVWLWPASRAWHTLFGWPHASVERPTESACVQAALSRMMQTVGGATVAAVGCLYGMLLGRPARLDRGTGEAVGELLATPLYSLADLVGIAGASLLALLSLIADTLGAAVGTLVGLLTAPCVAYGAWMA